MTTHAEHLLQTAVGVMAPRVILGRYRFRAFDRSKDWSSRQHIFEAARGIRGGTPDTELVFEGRSINVELKKPGTKHLKKYQPSEDQLREMEALRAAGAYADVAWSLMEVLEHWARAGVALNNSARAYAEAADASLMARIQIKAAAVRAKVPAVVEDADAPIFAARTRYAGKSAGKSFGKRPSKKALRLGLEMQRPR